MKLLSPPGKHDDNHYNHDDLGNEENFESNIDDNDLLNDDDSHYNHDDDLGNDENCENNVDDNDLVNDDDDDYKQNLVFRRAMMIILKIMITMLIMMTTIKPRF